MNVGPTDVVYSWEKNTRERVVASIGWFHGHELADVRVWVLDDDGDDMPTRKGLSIRLEDLPQLAAAVDALMDAAGLGRAAA